MHLTRQDHIPGFPGNSWFRPKATSSPRLAFNFAVLPFFRPTVGIATSVSATLLLTISLVGSGCYTSHTRTPVSNTHLEQRAEFPESEEIFKYEKTKIPYVNNAGGTGDAPQYELLNLQILSAGENGQDGNLITARYFKSALSGTHPLLIVMPIWGSYTYPPRKISSMVQNKSRGHINVLEVLGENYLLNWTGLVATETQESFLDLWRIGAEHQRITVIDIRRLIDWAEQRSEIDGSKVALIGFSHSAMVAGTIVTQEPRLAATVLVMGGAHTHSIIAHCDGVRTSSVQEKARLDFSWDRDDLEAELKPVFSTLDPAVYPGRVDPTKILIIDSGRDACIPETSREDLWKALGRPERITFNYGHKKSFLSMTPLGLNWMRRRIWEFLEVKLLTP